MFFNKFDPVSELSRLRLRYLRDGAGAALEFIPLLAVLFFARAIPARHRCAQALAGGCKRAALGRLATMLVTENRLQSLPEYFFV